MAKASNNRARVGDTVFFSLQNGPRRGEYRPALVSRVNEYGVLDLSVFTAQGDEQPSVLQVTNAVYNSSNVPGTWRDKP